jgi:hypothetical protein
MHFEILVEDASGKILLESVIPKILEPYGTEHTFRIHSYKGIGVIPKGLQGKSDPKKRILLDRLPKILAGYGTSLSESKAVIVVVDLDQKNCIDFKNELLTVLHSINPVPKTLFRIAIEEIEAWILGDQEAICRAYPEVKTDVINSYVQDSICGTWEKLADAIYKGGANTLTKLGYPHIGQAKCEWAEKISPYFDIEANLSKSFQVFRDGIRKLLHSR